MTLQYLIVDDEPLAHRVIEKYSKDLPQLTSMGNCYDAIEAMAFLNKQSVDLIFLDINMPKLKGLDFLRTIKNPPLIILTTAYKEYALESYELDICDYLLKPFSFERFFKAIHKAMNTFSTKQEPLHSKQEIPAFSMNQTKTIFVKGDKKYHQIHLDDILYLESYGNYVKIHLQNEMILTNERLSFYEKNLSSDHFVRVHKSYIVANQKINLIEGNRIKIKDHQIPIGSVYKWNVNKLLGR